MRSIYRGLFTKLVILVPLMASAETWRIAHETRVDDVRQFVEPAIGEQTVREIGEPLVRSGIRRLETKIFRTVTLKDSIDVRMGLAAMYRKVQAPSGTSGPMMYYSDKKNPMMCVTPLGAVTTQPSETAGCFVDTDNDGRFDSVAFPGYAIDKNLADPVVYEAEVRTESIEIEDPRSFVVEVLYQGISKGEAKISYREFIRGTARPAFTQDISYELESDGSGVIAFRGLRIQIVKATRENITYIVKKLGQAPT